MSHAEYIAGKYANATKEQLLEVVYAADRRWAIWAEFGTDPDGAADNDLDTALEKCAGTSAFALKSKLV